MRMDCRQFEEVVHDLDRPGAPGLALREVALAHAESCGSCARLLTDSEALGFSLQTIAAHDERAQASPRVEAAVLREMRRVATSRHRRQWRMVALGVASAVLLVLGGSLRHMSMGRRDATAADQSARRTGSGAGSKADNASSDWQDATAFVSLPYAADPATLEGGTVVRVVLSRSALMSMGMPVTDAGTMDRIPADIMLSEDGAPQAIRLVSQVSLGQ